MSFNVSDVRLDGLHNYWADRSNSLDWPYPFVLPAWMEAWWACFGEGNEAYIRAVDDGESVIGIAPLMIDDGTASFIGNADVCDYQDFIVSRGREKDFFSTLCSGLKSDGISKLELRHVRPDSHTMTYLAAHAAEHGIDFTSEKEDVSVEMDLPGDFEEYLASLDKKQRHEARRKMRKLQASGNVVYRVLENMDDIRPVLDDFFSMFVESREDKASFLDDRMKEYFKLLMEKLGGIGIFRLGLLELDAVKVAALIFFDYRERRYLYNCGYAPDYTGLSVGAVSKLMTIKDSIERGFKTFDFLKGDEMYKFHLGGREVPLACCRMNLT